MRLRHLQAVNWAAQHSGYFRRFETRTRDCSGRGHNVYMPLYLYNTVMRLDAVTGILTRVAGNRTYGFNDDDGAAISTPTVRSPWSGGRQRRQRLYRGL